MNKFNRFSLVVGYFLLIAGAGILVFGLISNGELRLTYIFTGAILIFIGGINFIVFRFLRKSFENFPDSIKNYDISMKGSAQKLSAAAEMLRQQNNMNRLASTGKQIKVRLLNLKDTGTLINYDALIEFQLEVLMEHSYDNYYINSHKQIVSKVMISRLKTGDVYPAKLDPEDKNNIYISWM